MILPNHHSWQTNGSYFIILLVQLIWLVRLVQLDQRDQLEILELTSIEQTIGIINKSYVNVTSSSVKN